MNTEFISALRKTLPPTFSRKVAVDGGLNFQLVEEPQ